MHAYLFAGAFYLEVIMKRIIIIITLILRVSTMYADGIVLTVGDFAKLPPGVQSFWLITYLSGVMSAYIYQDKTEEGSFIWEFLDDIQQAREDVIAFGNVSLHNQNMPVGAYFIYRAKLKAKGELWYDGIPNILPEKGGH